MKIAMVPVRAILNVSSSAAILRHDVERGLALVAAPALLEAPTALASLGATWRRSLALS